MHFGFNFYNYAHHTAYNGALASFYKSDCTYKSKRRSGLIPERLFAFTPKYGLQLIHPLFAQTNWQTSKNQ